MPIAPRGARLVGLVFDVLSRHFEGQREREAARGLMRRAAEADSVRNHAYRIQATDPGMAADLFAAADRHVA